MNKGFTLVELMLAMVIAALISVGVLTLTMATFKLDLFYSGKTVALQNVESAIDSISKDVRQSNLSGSGSLNGLTISIPEYPGGTSVVQYTIVSGDLYRNGGVSTQKVADNISGTWSSANGVTTLSVSSAGESKTVQVEPRVGE